MVWFLLYRCSNKFTKSYSSIFILYYIKQDVSCATNLDHFFPFLSISLFCDKCNKRDKCMSDISVIHTECNAYTSRDISKTRKVAVAYIFTPVYVDWILISPITITWRYWGAWFDTAEPRNPCINSRISSHALPGITHGLYSTYEWKTTSGKLSEASFADAINRRTVYTHPIR